MKRLFIILLTIISVSFAQNIDTRATYYEYRNNDPSLNIQGECDMPVYIRERSITLQTDPSLLVLIDSRFVPRPYMDGDILEMQCTDNENISCTVKLFISPSRKELHIIYANVDMGYILE